MQGDPTGLQGDRVIELVIPAHADAVRAALRTLVDTLVLRALPDSAREAAELVLAEALNNVVEHAYARCDRAGEIQLTLRSTAGGLACQIVDRGSPMPDGVLPAGKLCEPDSVSPAEGGWGWHLIRTLSSDLAYSRDGDRNHLSFRLRAD